MSLRQGSLKTPLAAGLVFCIGVGLGVGWKLGWIPVEYHPAKSGTLEDPDQTATTDPDSEVSDDPLAKTSDDSVPAWDADQGEPPVEEGVNAKLSIADDSTLPEDPEVESVPIIRAAKPQPLTKSQQRKPRRMPETSERVQSANYEQETDETPKSADSAVPAEEPAEDPVPKSAGRFTEIDEQLAAGEFLAAHKALSKLYWSAKTREDELQERLETTAQKIFFSPQPHFIEPYVVQSGDQLRKIAGKYNLSWEYLAKLNKTDPRRIREGQKLKVLKGPFAAIVSLRDFSLTIHLQGYYVKRYQVGIGKDGSSPIGKFPVLGKLENPQYTDPEGRVIEGDDPKNPLGERWIDLGDSYGIHGTIEPDSIGTAASRGCIRLRDDDIIEVYNFLVKDSTVELRD